MKFCWIYTLLIINVACYAQNLVPNPSFETYTLCPNTIGQIELAVPWTAATTDNSSTDYYNACSGISASSVPKNQTGFQYPRTGNSYAGLAFCLNTGLREYLQIQLGTPLVQNKTYNVEFYVNSSNSSVNSNCNNIAANLSIVRPYTTTQGVLQGLTPHIILTGNPVINDTLNWVKISGCYTAQGGEEYLTIGNFFDNANTQVGGTGIAYYYVDDILVEEITGQCVTGINEYKKDGGVSVYPNPNNGNFNLVYSFERQLKSFELYDVMGRKVMQKQLTENKSQLSVNAQELSNGIYMYKIIDATGISLYSGRLIISK